MRGSLAALLGVVALSTGCSLEPLDLAEKRCPCATGYQCDDARDRCVAVGGPTCTPAISPTGFRAAWSTANAIRYEWVPAGGPDAFVRYELHIAERPEDLGTARARIVGPSENPELGGYVLPRLRGSDDLVTATTVDGLRASTTYAAELVAIDTSFCAFHSEVAARATSLEPPAEIVIFRDADPPGSPSPPAFLPVDDGMGGRVLEHRPDEDPECIASGEMLCSQNLKLTGLDLDLSRVTEGSFASVAFLELSIASDSTSPSFFGRVWLNFEGGAHIFRIEPITIRANGSFHVLQVPLRVLSDGTRTLTQPDLALAAGGTPLFEFNVGGNWSRRTAADAPVRVHVDEIRVRY